MSRSHVRSITLPIVLGSATVLLTIALLVGFILIVVQNLSLTREVAENTWVLVVGIVSFAVVMSATVMLSIFVVREILEARRQYTFIDSVTHELKSPLASLKLCLETSSRPELSPAQREELRNMMLDDVDRLSEFIDDVLEASRISGGRKEHALGKAHLDELVRHSVEVVEKRHKLSPGTIHVAVPELDINTDVTALELLLRNLLDNAVKYSRPQDLDVRVSAHTDGRGRLEIVVRDSGIGIAKQHHKRIFERFYRVPTADVYARRGTGLGLFVVGALVRRLGGRIDVRSDGRQPGTSMHVTLPFLATAPAHEAHRAVEETLS